MAVVKLIIDNRSKTFENDVMLFRFPKIKVRKIWIIVCKPEIRIIPFKKLRRTKNKMQTLCSKHLFLLNIKLIFLTWILRCYIFFLLKILSQNPRTTFTNMDQSIVCVLFIYIHVY